MQKMRKGIGKTNKKKISDHLKFSVNSLKRPIAKAKNEYKPNAAIRTATDLLIIIARGEKALESEKSIYSPYIINIH
jgi:hypothetical protein